MYIFSGNDLLFARLCDCKFEVGLLAMSVPSKLQQIFVRFFLTYARNMPFLRINSCIYHFFSVFCILYSEFLFTLVRISFALRTILSSPFPSFVSPASYADSMSVVPDRIRLPWLTADRLTPYFINSHTGVYVFYEKGVSASACQPFPSMLLLAFISSVSRSRTSRSTRKRGT